MVVGDIAASLSPLDFSKHNAKSTNFLPCGSSTKIRQIRQSFVELLSLKRIIVVGSTIALEDIIFAVWFFLSYASEWLLVNLTS